MALLRPAFLLLILFTLITGGLYPLITTALGQWWFNDQANGSLIREGDAIRGSHLLGQDFSAPGYFHGRPSATADAPYNPMASGGSNLAGSNPELDKEVAQRVAQLRAANPQADAHVPVDLITASASGPMGKSRRMRHAGRSRALLRRVICRCRKSQNWWQSTQQRRW